MSKGVFIHNQKSKYDDQPESHYHFPKLYLDRAKPFQNDWILYYESGKNYGRKSYTATAKVQSIVPDKKDAKMFYAIIEPGSYLPFEHLVPQRINGQLANSFISNEDGTANAGRQVWAVRSISDGDFNRIVNIGLPDDSDDLPRDDNFEVAENSQQPFDYDFERDRIEVKLGRMKRDRVFRTCILNAYDKRCAFTGLRFINGGGRAEVQAAHIKPVSERGPDSVNNGIALSGTVHWMFDRGLLSLSNDFDIITSRHVNNTGELDRLLVKDRRAILPKDRSSWPHPSYLEWHRGNVLKT